MKIKSLAVVLALVSSAPAMAACTDTFNLGVMGPALRGFGNSFNSVQRFEDCYNFTLSSPADDAFGFTFEFDGTVRRNIELSSITLVGGGLSQSISDGSPSTFSFNNLLAGAYQFVVAGNVTGRNGGGFFNGGSVGYGGAFATSSATIAAPVPEPETYALLALGLLAVGSVVRRRNNA